MFNRYKHHSLDTLRQMQRREIDYVERKYSREPEWLGSESFHARMRTIHLLQREIRCREADLTAGIES